MAQLNYNIQVDDFKKAALYILRGMNIRIGVITIEANTAYDNITIKVSEIKKKIKEDGGESTVTETRVIK